MYKLGLGLQDGSICLRCLCRLSLQGRQRPQRQRDLQPIRRFALSRRLGQEQADYGASHREQGALDEPLISYHPYEKGPKRRNVEKIYHFNPDIPGEPTVEYNPTSPPSQIPDLPRGLRSFPVKDSLGLNSLGQPAEVLILRDSQEIDNEDGRFFQRQPSELNDETSPDTMSSSDMLAEMSSERGIIETAQVCKNIDAVKEEWLREFKLPWEDLGSVVAAQHYNEIASRLYEGFTASQLAAYLEKNPQTHPIDPLDLHNDFSCSLYARSCWNHGTTGIWRIRAPEIPEAGRQRVPIRKAVQEHSEEHVPYKRSLINGILHHCWGIRPRDDDSSVGELDIQLQKTHLELIVNHGEYCKF